MLKNFKENLKIKWFKQRSLFIAKFIKFFLHVLIKTCYLEIEGIEQFYTLAKKEKCILMLWHNRLAIALFVLSKYTAQLQYAALVSGSRDGTILSNIIHSYKNGDTIRVPHSARYQALRHVIECIEQKQHIVIITPDGPRGPCYEIKPGIAIAALETEAHVISFNWEASKFWELKTWDKFRLPKPFTTIRITFKTSICFNHHPQPSLEEIKLMLKTYLSDVP